MKLLLITTFVFGAFVNLAQVATEKRIEIELNDEFENERVYEFGSKGFIMTSKSESKAGGDYTYKIERYDTDLESTKIQEIMLDKGFRLDETFVNDDFIYQLYKDRKNNVKIVSTDAETLVQKVVDFELPGKMYINDLKVLKDFAYITAYKGGKPSVLAVDLATSQMTFYPIEIEGFKSKKLKIENIQLLEESNEIFIFIEAIVTKKTTQSFIVRMDSKGGMKDTYNFSQTLEELITSATASYISPGKYVVTGTYSTKNRSVSEGMYFAIIKDGVIDKMNFYNFLDLDNFLNYLPVRKQEKIEKKKKRKADRGKEMTIRYLLAPHNVIQTDDGYIFLAEAYYPTYRTEYYTTYRTVNGVSTPVQATRQVFDGYQYTHAFFAKFNLAGEMEWDQSFKMWMAYKPFYVKRFINIAEQNQDNVKLVYASYNRIFTKQIGFDGEVKQEEDNEVIETQFEGDKTKSSFSNISFWYDNYFLAYGSQKIKNKTDGNVARKRKVYFVNKISFE